MLVWSCRVVIVHSYVTQLVGLSVDCVFQTEKDINQCELNPVTQWLARLGQVHRFCDNFPERCNLKMDLFIKDKISFWDILCTIFTIQHI